MYGDSIRKITLTALFSILILLGASSSRGAADSLCCSFSGSPGLKLTLDRHYSVRGALPFRLCDLGRGLSYEISIYGRGYEKRTAEMRFGPDGLPAISGRRLETVIMNGVIPGSGTVSRGRAQQGYIDLFSIAGGLYKFYRENSDYHDLKDRYDRLNSYLARYGESASDDLRREAHRAYVYADQQNSYRKKLFLMTSALYAFQVLEPLFMDAPPVHSIKDGGGRILFEGSRRSRGRAFLYSLIRPGRGQYYQGKKLRGLFFTTVSVMAGYIALDQNNQYKKRVDDYDIAVEEYNYAGTLSERQRYLAEAEILRADAEDAKNNRNLSLYILAGVWGANIIDTLLFDCRYDDCGYSFNVTPGGLELAYSF